MKKTALFSGLFTAIVYESIMFASCPTQENDPEYLKVLTFNIDTNIGRTEENYARDSHPEWRVGARMPKIQAALKKIYDEHAPDVIHLQEGRKFVTIFGDEVDSITPLVSFLQSLGYQVAAEQYNPSDRSFSYITAIKKGFVVDGYEKIYLTKTPDRPTDHTNHKERIAEIKSHNFGEEWERSIFVTNFHDAKGRQYRARNMHLGIVESARYASCEMIRQDSEQAIAKNPTILEVSTGDCNTFSDWGGPRQLEILTKNGILKDASKDLRLPNGQEVHFSFVAYPYDYAADEQRLNEQCKKDTGMALPAFLSRLLPRARKETIEKTFAAHCKALCGKLDRALIYGFLSAKTTLLLTPQFQDFDADHVSEESVKDFILRHHHEGPAFASDHQPILVTLQLPPVPKK